MFSRNQRGERRVSPSLHKFLLTAHITVSVGWLGVVLAKVGLGILAMTTAAPAVTDALVMSMKRLNVAFPPLAIGTAITGVLLSLGTKWGLLRYYWVVTKQVLTVGVVATAVQLSNRMMDGAFLGIASSPATLLVGLSVTHVLMLGVATVVSVYKPWGKTWFGRRADAARRPRGGAVGAARKGVVATIVVTIAFAAASVIPGAAPVGAARAEFPVVPPKIACEALASKDFASLADAPTQIEGAKVVPAVEGTPEHCLVTGYIAPQIQFKLYLPTQTWAGRYLQIGCGGFCGYMTDPSTKVVQEGQLGGCTPSDLGGLAVAFGDSGHAGTNALWAQDAPQARIDWGYQSEHVLSIASKAIIAAFYGQAPRNAYFAGCSNGGRQALMLAQRFPDDFDGILAGAPVNAMPAVMLALAWDARANTAADGGTILTPETLPLLHRAALAACDGRDGLNDGQIADPRACRFDPASMQCPDGNAGTDCLTPAQVEAARKIYAGPTDEQGRRLYPGGLAVGSELQWQTLLFGFPGGYPALAEGACAALPA